MRFFTDRRKESGTAAAETTAKAALPAGKRYTERDNRGTRQETMAQALAYWKNERPALPDETPFTLFTFPSAAAAEEAMLALPFIHKATDSGKLVCDRSMTFGYYPAARRGAAAGPYEALVTGSDLTQEELRFTETAFSEHQGRCKARCVPAAARTSPEAGGNAALVRYSETIHGCDGVSTYEVYTGPDRASAIAFLWDRQIDRRYYYMVVDTPEGSFGRDRVGLYQE